MCKLLFVLACLCLFLTSSILVLEAFAHAPLGTGENESLETALLIPDPSKSWALYTELHEGGEARYYRLSMQQDERIFVSLLKPTTSEDRDFLPGLVLMGPNLTTQGAVPEYVEVPEGYASIVTNGVQPPQADYEPFSPSSLYTLAEIDVQAPRSGDYYVAVFDPDRGGHYGLAIGYVEEFTLDEWILIPFNLISIYQWERQSLIVIFAPLVATLVIGLALIIWKNRIRISSHTLSAWIAVLAGLLFMGTGFMTLYQMAVSLSQTSIVPEVAVTILFASIPIILGLLALRLSLKTEKVSRRTRIYLAIIGVAAIFMWAGLLIGPVLAIIASLLPSPSTPEEPNSSRGKDQ